MTMFTGWTGWLIFITALIAAWLLCATGIAATWHLAKCAYLRRQRRLDQLIATEQARIDRIIMNARTGTAERLWPDGDDNQAWPPDLCHFPPCGWEDNWVCAGHRQPEPGKHRLGSSQSRGHEVIQAVVTDLPDPWDSRWSR